MAASWREGGPLAGMGQVVGVDREGVRAGGLVAKAQNAAMKGNSVAAVFAPAVVSISVLAATAALFVAQLLRGGA